ncbi:hypothetical protein Bca52824_031597 [Brassica carinata]|uniref:Uncharacterized protein n=1 Tax=Brassica carinata TaxID=52824 RepID=A0A8X7V7V6_BRACI|nr:hypothetical protein Bca52824_031597 [Brassica carinata]
MTLGLQFSDNDHAIGNSVESCKDGSKSQNCPERSGMMQLEVPEIGKNDYNVCKLFYDTSTGDDASTGGIKRMTEAILVEILERLEISHKLITLMLTVVLLRQLIRCFMWTRMIRQTEIWNSRENFVDAEGSSHCNQEHLIVTREATD